MNIKKIQETINDTQEKLRQESHPAVRKKLNQQLIKLEKELIKKKTSRQESLRKNRKKEKEDYESVRDPSKKGNVLKPEVEENIKSLNEESWFLEMAIALAMDESKKNKLHIDKKECEKKLKICEKKLHTLKLNTERLRRKKQKNLEKINRQSSVVEFPLHENVSSSSKNPPLDLNNMFRQTPILESIVPPQFPPLGNMNISGQFSFLSSLTSSSSSSKMPLDNYIGDQDLFVKDGNENVDDLFWEVPSLDSLGLFSQNPYSLMKSFEEDSEALIQQNKNK